MLPRRLRRLDALLPVLNTDHIVYILNTLNKHTGEGVEGGGGGRGEGEGG